MLYTTLAVSCLLTSTLAVPSFRELKHRHFHHDTSASTDHYHHHPSGTAGPPYGIANATSAIYTASAGPTATGAVLGAGTVQTTPSTGTEAEAANSKTGSDTGSDSDSGTDTEAANSDTQSGSGSGTDSDSANGAACAAGTVTVTASPTVTITVQAGAAAAATTSAAGTHGSAQSPTEEPDSVSSPTTPSASPSSAAGSSSSDSSSGTAPSSTAAAAPISAAPATSSAAAATPSTAPTTGGGDTPSGGTAAGLKTKRGIIASGSNMDGLAKAFGNTKISWLGNWFSAPPPDLPSSITFVPQMYGKGSDDNGEWTKNAQKAVQEGEKYMLSFGEPGTPNPTRYMNPQDGAAYWMQYMEPYAKQGVKIGAPGTLQNTQDFQWLSSFLDACTECTISFIAMHWFDKAGAAQVPGFKDTLNKAKALAGNKPIWLDNFSAAGSAADQKEFLGEVVPWLEQQENIQAYAYCPPDVATAGVGGGMLDGDALNDLGQYYANL